MLIILNAYQYPNPYSGATHTYTHTNIDLELKVKYFIQLQYTGWMWPCNNFPDNTFNMLTAKYAEMFAFI